MGPPGVVSPPDENDAKPHAQGEAGEPHHRIQITTAKTQQSPPGASQKNKRTDHRKGSEDEAHHRGRSVARLELPEDEARKQGPENKAHDLRSQVLHHGSPVQPKRAGDIPLKTGRTNPHVGRITELLNERREQTHNGPGEDHPPIRKKGPG